MTWRARAARRAKRSDESGTTVVEGALIFSIFLMLVMAVLEFGFFFMFWSTGRSTVTEGGHELGIGGSSALSDYDALKGIRTPILRLGDKVNYIIVYRAKNISTPVPPECITAAEAGLADTSALAAFTPYGYFSAPGESDPQNFNWFGPVRPSVACNVYFPRTYDILKTHKSSFITNLNPLPGDVDGLDKFWPGAARTDWISGPIDYAGIYVNTTYRSMTGIIPSRTVSHRSIVPIEPKKSTR
jgi:hypothetical protein